MADIAALTQLIEPEAKAEGLELVRVRMTGGASDPTLQIMAERPDTRQLSLEDCSRLSRRVSELLDESDPIDHAYRLEISSPGIDRPLTRLRDYDDWKGHEARILAEPSDSGAESPADDGSGRGPGGRKAYKGVLLGSEGETVLLEVKGAGAIALPFAAIHSAKLILTDKLIKATAPLDAADADLIDTEGN